MKKLLMLGLMLGLVAATNWASAGWTEDVRYTDGLFTEEASKATPATKTKSRRIAIATLIASAHTCERAGPVRVDFLLESVKTHSVVVPRGSAKKIKIKPGSYDVRVFIKKGSAFELFKTNELKVDQDDFTLKFGCPAPKKTRGSR